MRGDDKHSDHVAELPLAEIEIYRSEIIDRIERGHGRIVLTRYGRPGAVMSPDDLASPEDTLELLELLSDPEVRVEIQVGRQDLAEGRTVTAEELQAKYLSRGPRAAPVGGRRPRRNVADPST